MRGQQSQINPIAESEETEFVTDATPIEENTEDLASITVATNAKKSPHAGDPDFQGVSVHFLRRGFLEEVREAGFTGDARIYEIEDLKGPPGVIRRKGMNVRCPVFDRIGAAYVNCLEGQDNVGDATHMLSYTWGYTIGDIVDTLEGFCKSQSLDPKRTYIWICCLCNNQHKIVDDRENGGVNVPPEEFETTFKARVIDIGNIICMMGPWDDPLYLSRVWCLFELHTAMQVEGCDIFIEMPTHEKQRLVNTLVVSDEDRDGNPLGELYEALSNTKVEEAQASVVADRDMILGLLEAEGFESTNVNINNHLRSWVVLVLYECVNDCQASFYNGSITADHYCAVCNNIGGFLGEIGMMEGGIQLLQESLNIRKEQGDGGDPIKAASSHNNIGLMLKNMGRYQEALHEFCKALAPCQLAFGEHHISTATARNNIGLVLSAMGRYQDALKEHRIALSIRQENMGENHPIVAHSYKNMGAVLGHLGSHDAALAAYKEALAIEEKCLHRNHPELARTLGNMGGALNKLGKLDEALESHRRSLAIMEVSRGPRHHDCGTAHNNLGLVLDDLKRHDEALEEYNTALSITEAALGKDHPGNATSHFNIATTLYRMSRFEEALAAMHHAFSIRQAKLGKSHPVTVDTLFNLKALEHLIEITTSAPVQDTKLL